MNVINIVISSMAVSQFVFLGANFLYHHRNVIGFLVAGFCVCAIAFLIEESSVLKDGGLLDVILGQLTTLAPFFIWLIASHLLIDERKEQFLAWMAILLCYFLEFYQVIAYPDLESQMDELVPYILLAVLPNLILLSFPLHAIYLAIDGYKIDLLEERRKFRIAFVAGLSTVIILIVLGNIFFEILQISSSSESDVYDVLPGLFLFIAALFFNFASTQSSSSASKLIRNIPSDPEVVDGLQESPTDSEIDSVRAIEHAMNSEKLFTEPGIAISDLANHVNLMEYRVRKIINNTMGYKNFNQFLNNFRIKEACRLLQGSKFQISQIAMDVGYSSLSVFNRAFKERVGETPSEYRRRMHSEFERS